MALLQEATMEQGAAKIGLFGSAGSGKTTTASMLAIGASKEYHGGAPVAFFDTEKGSDFVLPIFNAEGVKLVRIKSRAFKDLVGVIKEAEQAKCCALVVDSISHIWTELIDAYCKAHGKNGRALQKPEFHHWKDIKATWKQWTDVFLNSPLHIFVAGRAGWDYAYEENEQGKKELIKTGTKMKAEGEFGYEPDMLIEMWTEHSQEGKRGSQLTHKAIVLKDRSWSLNGKELKWEDSPAYKQGDYMKTFKVFQPHFKALNMGGSHVGVQSERNSEDMFDPETGKSQATWARRKDIALEIIEQTMTLLWPGQTAQAKQIKIRVIEKLFKTRSWTEVTGKSAETLETAAKTLQQFEMLAKSMPPETEEGVMELLTHAAMDLQEQALEITEEEKETVPF